MSARRRAEPTDVDVLLVEVHRYLAAVDAFREEGCDVRWRAERRSRPAAQLVSERRK
jgi:hypothetical protein